MTRALRHRGPDGEGFDSWSVSGPEVVHFGHRRLAVIDLEGGGQPMRTAEGGHGIAFNGEIYNFSTLRGRLESEGCRFRTRSDTEVLLYALARWSEGALSVLDGMFAFAFFDRSRSRLMLAVDRFGQKPLFWSLLPDRRLVFGSELNALRHHPGFGGRVAPLSLCRMLAFNQTPGSETIWRGASRLEAGSALLARLDAEGRVEDHYVARYWKPEEALGRVEVVSDRELLDVLDESVVDHLVADVPVGVLLSGGIDSTTVAALASRHGPIHTISMGSEEEDYDESSVARRTAERLGTTHHELRMTSASALATLDAVMRHLDEPLADAGCLPAWELFRQTRGMVKVAIGGDGGDELLEGYPTYLALEMSRWLPGRPLGSLSRLAELLPVSEGYYPLGFQVRRFLAGLKTKPCFRLSAYIGGCGPSLLGEVLRRDVLEEAGLDPKAPDFEDRLYEPACPLGERDLLSRLPPERLAVYSHVKSFLTDGVLRKVDRMSMAHGLEVRAPMLGSRFAEMCLALPARRKRWGAKGKRPLREWLNAASLSHVTRRGKRGFAIPVSRWLRDPLRPLGDELFLSAATPLKEWCRMGPVGELWRRHVDRRGDGRKELWALLTLGVWALHHLNGNGASPEREHE